MLVLAVAAGTAVAVQGGVLSFSKSCEDSAIRLSVMASPDIAPADKARTDETKSDGHCLHIQVVARDSYKVADALSAGTRTPDYQIWLPDSDLWLDRARGSGDGVPITPGDSIASSPVTLALVPSAAKTLGWPKKKYSWAELMAAAMESDKVRLGAADPGRSATGLLALTSIASSSDKQGGDSDTRVAATAKLLAQRMSDGDTQVLETLAQDSGAEEGNPRRNQAVLLSEQAAFAHNAGSTGGGKLELFYPKDAASRVAGRRKPAPFVGEAVAVPGRAPAGNGRHRARCDPHPPDYAAGRPTGQLCTGSPVCINSAYRRVVAASAVSRSSPASSPR